MNDDSIFDDLTSQDSPTQGQKRKAHSRPVSRASVSSTQSSDTLQLKEMAVDALRSMNQAQPKDKFGALGEYIAAELRSLTPQQAEYAKSKLNRSFNDIVDEAISNVSIIFHLDISFFMIFNQNVIFEILPK